MKEVLLIIVVLGVLIYGYFLMGKLDKFLNGNRKTIDKESDKKEPSCVMLTGELSDEEIAKEIRLFIEKHVDTKILLCDFTNAELLENCDQYFEGKK